MRCCPSLSSIATRADSGDCKRGSTAQPCSSQFVPTARWRSRTAPVYLYDRDRGLINATADLLALVEALHHAWREGEQLRRRQPDMP